jgi:FixJ family two-component response regulator
MTAAESIPLASATVYLVDDDASYLAATARLLKASGYAVRTFGSAGEFLSALPADPEGCVLADLHMPRMSGLELQAELLRREQPLPVVFLTGQGDIPTSVKAMRQGAEDFLTKLAPKADLLNAVNRALARGAKERAARARQGEVRGLLARLTDRELDILAQVVRGRLNKQIAGDLGISERTVKLHRTSLTSKLGMPSVAELTKLWLESGRAVG